MTTLTIALIIGLPMATVFAIAVLLDKVLASDEREFRA